MAGRDYVDGDGFLKWNPTLSLRKPMNRVYGLNCPSVACYFNNLEFALDKYKV